MRKQTMKLKGCWIWLFNVFFLLLPAMGLGQEAIPAGSISPEETKWGFMAAAIAVGADGIIANPGTITGSIGVVMGFTNFQELLRKIGLKPVVVKSGAYKDIGSPVRAMTQEEKQILQTLSDQIHRQFINAIAS